ncbi:MAG: translocation/assembly module TamB domain-containing protein [Bacteroidaceae bacterium]|nr:translocation/assembly module TamB domain-containing protein [Bacteroidaceae bacterium]
MKRFLLWAAVILATPVVLVLLLFFLLYLPPVQDYAVRKAMAVASEETGLDVQIDRLRLRPLLDLDLQGFTAVDADGDTLLSARHLVVDLDMTSILKGRVGLDALELSEAQVNSKELIAAALIRGSLQRLVLTDDVDLKAQRVLLKDITGTGLDLDIALRDTLVEEDTTVSEPLPWVIEVQQAALTAMRLRFATPGDSMAVMTHVNRLALSEVTADLGRQLYQVKTAGLNADSVWTNQLPRIDAFADSSSRVPVFLQTRLQQLQMDASDIVFDGERGHLALPSMNLQTPTSKVTAAADLDFNALTAGQGGGLMVSVETSLSREDVLAVATDYLPAGFSEAYPDVPLNLRLSASGNMEALTLDRIEAALPGSIYLDASGKVGGLAGEPPSTLWADVAFNAELKDLNWLRPLADGALDGIALPPMTLGGKVTADGPTYGVDALLHEGAGVVGLKGTVDTREAMTYDATVSVNRLNVRHFLPRDSIGVLSLTAKAHGSGTDIFDRATKIAAEARVTQLNYGHYDLSGMTAKAQVSGGRGKLQLDADNKLLTATATADALLAKKTNLTFGLDLQRADLQALGLIDHPMKAAMCLHVDGTTNLSDHHQMEGFISDMVIVEADSVIRWKDIEVSALLRPDTTHVFLQSGDLLVTANGHTGYDRLLTQLDHFTTELSRQLADRRLDQDALRARLPLLDVRVQAGHDNPFYNGLKMLGYEFENVRFAMTMNPHDGVNGGGRIYKLNTGAVLLDTIGFHAYHDSTGMRLDARIHNDRRNPQISFEARMTALLLPTGASANLLFFDDRGRKGVDLGAVATMEEEGFRLHVEPLNPVIAYRTFRLNPDNYVMLGREGRINADLDLQADDGTGLKLYSTPNDEALQDLSVSVNRLNLGELMSVLPYAPHITGFLHGDAHLIQTPDHLSVSADMNVNDMTYEGAALGQLGVQAVYLPNADGSHFIDGSLLQTGMPVATFSGTYTPKGEQGLLDITTQLERLPFSLANGFIPDGLARLEGVAIGEMHVGGTTDKPVVDGFLTTSGLKLLSDAYSLRLSFQDDTIRVAASDLQFDRIEVYSVGKNPFVLDGGINFSNLDRITVNTTMAAKDFELINAKKTQKAQAYGKVFVDFNAFLRGTLDNLTMYGRLNVLPDTDVTYVLTDSPLSAEDQLAELVEFVDFEDSLRVLEPESTMPQNLNVIMNVNIADAAQVHCLLSPDASSYVDLEGGGELSMTYSPEKDLQLTGRYTINSGTIKYTMMVIPLKEFTIRSGSYVEFRGPLMNPTLNLTATERVRTTVTENEHPRSVSFDVGLSITQTLQNMGLEFTLEAPEDLTIQNELASMSKEQRGRLAVTMLATGMYINDAGSATQGGVNGQNALNAFLQSQISNITGKALKSVDLSVGLEQGTTASGSTTTDYSFRFAKRFWGNRVSVIVGGRVSTGNEVENNGQSIIDNVSVEYRLDKSASRYIHVFYDKSYESLMDGEILEMGAGLVLRKKSARLGELFLFKKKDKNVP